MKSWIFSTNRFEEIAKHTQEFLNAHKDFLSSITARSARAVGEAIGEILGEHFQSILGEDCAEYSANFTRRAMADLAFKDRSAFTMLLTSRHIIGKMFSAVNR